MGLLKKITAQKVSVDIICFALVLFLWLLIKWLCEPFHRGFWCDDQTIRYPFKDSSNASLFLVIWCFLLPAITIIVFETIRVKKTITFSDKENLMRWKYLIWKVYKKLSVFYFAAISLLLITTVIKYTTGRLRPDFIYLCQPDIDCNKEDNQFLYVENYTCINDNKNADQISDARMSFISGHSTYSSYCAIYFCIYLHIKMKSYVLISLRTVLQLMSILTTVFVGLNRIAINKHHWSDVLFGLILGTFWAIITIKYFTFTKDKNQPIFVDNNLKDNNEIKMTKNCDHISQC